MSIKMTQIKYLGSDHPAFMPGRFNHAHFDILADIYKWDTDANITCHKSMYLEDRTSGHRCTSKLVREEEPARNNGMVPVKLNDVHQEQTPEDSQEARTEQLELGLDTGVPSKRADNNPLTFITLEVQS